MVVLTAANLMTTDNLQQHDVAAKQMHGMISTKTSWARNSRGICFSPIESRPPAAAARPLITTSRSFLTLTVFLLLVLSLCATPCCCHSVFTKLATHIRPASGNLPSRRVARSALEVVAAVRRSNSNAANRRRIWLGRHGASGTTTSSSSAVTETTYSLNLRPFVDALPIPTTIDLTSPIRNLNPLGKGESKPDVVLGAYRIKWKFHRDLPASPVYAFGRSRLSASVPGPTLVAARNESLRIRWLNTITDASHLFPVDETLGMVPNIAAVGVPFVPHLHGGHVQSSSDGHPSAWFTASGSTGPSFSSATHHVPNTQPAATMWYHDHTVGLTRLNVEAGLYGAYLLTDKAEDRRLRLPEGRHDVPLLFQDKSFYSNGSIYVATEGDNPDVHPYWVPESFGNYSTVNGKINPYFNVEPRKYRFRLVNGNLARFLGLSFLALHSTVPTSAGANHTLGFTQIASDGGFLTSPVPLSYLLLAPGERAEIIIDFSSLPFGSRVLLLNNASAPYPDGDDPTAPITGLLQVRVRALWGRDRSVVPQSLPPLPPLQPETAANYPAGRAITLSEKENADSGEPEYSRIEGKAFDDPASIVVTYGSKEIWNIINLTGDTHPIHVHFVAHRVISRRPFDSAAYQAGTCTVAYDSGSCYTGPAEAPDANEMGLKDTTKAPPGYVTSLLFDFKMWDLNGTAPFDPTAGPGYVIHCHILDHEDNEMMRPVKIIHG